MANVITGKVHKKHTKAAAAVAGVAAPSVAHNLIRDRSETGAEKRTVSDLAEIMPKGNNLSTR